MMVDSSSQQQQDESMLLPVESVQWLNGDFVISCLVLSLPEFGDYVIKHKASPSPRKEVTCPCVFEIIKEMETRGAGTLVFEV